MVQPASIMDWLPAAVGVPAAGLPGLLKPTSLDHFELLQTPGLWGHDPADNTYWEATAPGQPQMPAASRRLLEAIEDVVAEARSWLDIASLQSFASGAFAGAIRRGLARACEGRTEPLTVRILYGRHNFARSGFVLETEEDFEQWVSDLVAELSPGAAVRVSACFMKTWCALPNPSWNHAKIIAADGRRAIVGGHNLWHDDYLTFAPVHDVSALIEGQAAGEAHRFLNQLWEWAGRQGETPAEQVLCHTRCWSEGRLEPEATPPLAALPEGQPGKTPVLALGRLGVGVMADPKVANAAAAAAPAIFSQARSSIRLSQMDFGFHYEGVNHWREDIVAALADVLTDPARCVEVSLVLSEVGAAVAVGGTYSFGTTYADVVAKVRGAIGDRSVTGHMQLAPLRSSTKGERWQHGERTLKFSNHAKVWIVDDRVLHVGSDNIYPHALQEFGYLIESEAIVRDVIAGYWEPLWRYSSHAAIDVC